MSEHEPEGPQPSPEPPTSRRRRWPVVLLVLTVLVAGAGLAVFVLLREGAGSSTADEWPADVSPLVDFVEKERDLAFTEPVPVEFLPVAEFRKEVQAEKSELTRQDRQEIEQTTGLLRAVGLIEGDVDLFDAGNDLAGAGVLGFYSHEDKLIRIRGDEMTRRSKQHSSMSSPTLCRTSISTSALVSKPSRRPRRLARTPAGNRPSAPSSKAMPPGSSRPTGTTCPVTSRTHWPRRRTPVSSDTARRPATCLGSWQR